MNQEENQKLKLPFSVSEIFGSNKKLALLHKNPLTNAESLIKKGQMRSALEIYTRTLTKIGDIETGKKISENIAKLKNYIKEFHPELDKNIQSKLSPAKTDNFSESLKEFSENLGDSLTEKLNILKQIETVPPENDEKDFPYDLGKLSPNNFPKRSEAKENYPNIGSMNIDADSIEIDQANFASDNSIEKPVSEKQNKEKPVSKQKAEFKQTELISDEEEIQEAETLSNTIPKEIIEEAEFYFSDELPLEEIEVKAEKVGKKFISESELAKAE